MESLKEKLTKRKEDYGEILAKIDNGYLTSRELELITYALKDAIQELEKILKE